MASRIVSLPDGFEVKSVLTPAVLKAVDALLLARLALVADCREQLDRPNMSAARIEDRRRLTQEHSNAKQDVSDALFAACEGGTDA